eukprot:CAMPEP_0198249872 /NCGR_PEP_ID=MMETSP1447-20131203/1251_1 /TAXON_ID=420782 /ORGANISM="Chaetoceros dichaeta, Strain CCMP1751" /LENGTH=126 /DNA_ID=CAMNT_0043934601 /DNA_START=163 /DNA_END=543 /DNA_ORIENTATION=+
MNQSRTLTLVTILILAFFTEGFTTPTNNNVRLSTPNNIINTNSQSRVSTSLYFFGGAKDDGGPGDYICKDCGYVFTKGPAAWAKLDDRAYKCPPCGSPKFRFKKEAKGNAKGKAAPAAKPAKKGWF